MSRQKHAIPHASMGQTDLEHAVTRQGLFWMSRRCGRDEVVVLVGDRVKKVLGGHVTAQIAKGGELPTFKVRPNQVGSSRWIVERSFAWLEKPHTVEEMRAQARHQPAVHTFGLPGLPATTIVNRLQNVGYILSEKHEEFCNIFLPTAI